MEKTWIILAKDHFLMYHDLFPMLIPYAKLDTYSRHLFHFLSFSLLLA